MFSWKKEEKTAEKRSNGGQRRRELGQIGLLDVPDFNALDGLDEGLDDNISGDEDELEAELRALEAGHDIRKVISRKRLEESFEPKKLKSEKGQGFVNAVEDDDDDEQVDENDPELLAELQDIESNKSSSPLVIPPSHTFCQAQVTVESKLRSLPTKVISSAPAPSPMPASLVSLSHSVPVAQEEAKSNIDILQDRLQNYKTAQVNAQSAGETAKIRRLDRGIKTLEAMLKSARAGKSIVTEDIPPPVAIGAKPKLELPKDGSNGPINQERVPTRVDSVHVLPAIPKSVLPQPDREMPLYGDPIPPPIPSRLRPVPLPPITPAKSGNAVVENVSSPNQASLATLTTRRAQYRQAALAAKRQNDETRMKEYAKIAKKFDLVISAIEQGQEVDLQGMPPPPLGFNGQLSSQSVAQLPSKLPFVPQSVFGPPKLPSSTASQPVHPSVSVNLDQPLELSAADPISEADDPSVFNAPPPPSSTLEALQQRLQKYKISLDDAKNSDNSSKARRMGRIVKQYEDAIKAYKAGKTVAFDDLPCPPGFAPIPLDVNPPKATSRLPPNVSKDPNLPAPPLGKPTKSEASSGHRPAVPLVSPSEVSNKAASTPSVPPMTPRQAPAPPKAAQKSPQSLYEKQLAVILERQQKFKAAAIDAKKRGDLQAAKEYLRVAKGFEPMINASKCGLPVNMDSLPLPLQPNQNNSFEMVNYEDCQPMGDREEMYEKLEKDLIAQIEMCAKNRVYFSKLGDVQNAQKFETMLLNTKKDLDFVRYSKKRGDLVPRFHYETKTFSIVKCCTELGDDDLELNIVKGINYACPNPSEVDTYVRFEFPFPQETPQKDKTVTVRDTNNPEYNSVFKLNINRKSRNCTSVFKRKGIKLEIWAKGGFLRSDVLLGTATIKLQPLETRCVLHDSFDLMEGRKPVGGKLEVKIRVRDPLITKQVETHCEKWLIVNDNKVTNK